MEKEEIEEIFEHLSPLERKVVPYLKEDYDSIMRKTKLDSVSLVRALTFLQNKAILKVESSSKTIIELGINGIYYKKNNLPERRFLAMLEKNNYIDLEEAEKISKLSDNEFKVSLGILKSKAMINLSKGKISLLASREEIIRKFPEEQFLEMLPIEYEELKGEMLSAFEQLKKRKNIVEIKRKNIVSFKLTDKGREIAGKEVNLDLIEEVTQEEILSAVRSKKFRKYDIHAPVPAVYGGKRHFVQNALEKARSIWLELGFKEMSGPIVDTSFWVFDALYTPQDHPAREMQDTFFLKEAKGKLPDEEIMKRVRKSHEEGIEKSRGWQYQWSEEEAKKVVLRTHTTSVSARTLAQIRDKELPVKYFSIGKVFRNESVDWSHNFEFYQTEGIVVSKDVNFRHLLGYLQIFYKKMGFEKIKFVPSFFAYTEPSVEVQVFHPKKKVWFELGGAGMFRPEVTAPLLGKHIPVLAWGQGFDRIIMDAYSIKDLRDMYSNDIRELRKKELL